MSSIDSSSPQVMGILNISPDSFWSGYLQTDWLKHAIAMVDAGAAILDIGGESTRPGAAGVTLQEELDRVIPVIERLRQTVDIPLSVDTSQPVVMQAALAAGVSFINDVRALSRAGAMKVVANSQARVCLMHMPETPAQMKYVPDYTDMHAPHYENVVLDVYNFLAARIKACIEAGIPLDRIVIDPGFGFSKTAAQSAELLKHLHTLTTLGCPVLVGLSRKSFISAVLNDVPVAERLPASLALALLARQNGASIIRVHDVKETVHALKIAEYVMKGTQYVS